MTEKTVWQDGKDFTLDVSVNLQNHWVYGKEKNPDVPDENLFSSTNCNQKHYLGNVILKN